MLFCSTRSFSLWAWLFNTKKKSKSRKKKRSFSEKYSPIHYGAFIHYIPITNDKHNTFSKDDCDTHLPKT